MSRLTNDIELLISETKEKIKDPEVSGTDSAWIIIDFADKIIILMQELIEEHKKMEARLESKSSYIRWINNEFEKEFNKKK